jgi:hypothetical protein
LAQDYQNYNTVNQQATGIYEPANQQGNVGGSDSAGRQAAPTQPRTTKPIF